MESESQGTRERGDQVTASCSDVADFFSYPWLLEVLIRQGHAGIPLETRKVLLGHASGDITTHYSAAELGELLDAAETVTDRGRAQSPTLTVVTRQKEESVGKLSEMRGKVSGC